MKIKTLIPVTYNSGIASQETGIVKGQINIINQDYYRNIYNFAVSYTNEAGDNINVAIPPFSLNKDEINAFYELIKQDIPADMAYFETTEYIYYLGFKIEMAKTFGITPNDIEIILETGDTLIG